MLQSDNFHNVQREIRNLVQNETICSCSFFLKCRSTLYMTSVGFDPFEQKSSREDNRKPHGGQNSIPEQDRNVMYLQRI